MKTILTGRYLHFFPRFYEGEFGGSIKILENGVFYEIRREFSGEKRCTEVRNLSSGRDETDPEGFISTLVGGISLDEYEETGFIRLESFAEDADKYRESEEKNREAKREAEIRNHFFNAKALLVNKRREEESGADDSLQAKRYLLDEEIRNTVDRLRNLREAIPEKEAFQQLKAQALQTEQAAVRRLNDEREADFKQEMLKAKQALSESLRSAKKDASKGNAVGILLLVLGLLGGIAAWFYRTSYAIDFTETDHGKYLVMLLATGVSALFVLAGIIVTVSVFVRKKAVQRNLIERSELNLAAEEAEKAYQTYLDHRTEIDDRVQDEDARKEELLSLENELGRLMEEKDAAEKKLETLSADDRTLLILEEKDREVRSELRAIDLAIATFDRVGKLNEGDDADEFSEAVTEFYRALLPERPAKIEVKNETITVELKDSGRHLLSQLSTGTMHETLIAVRLAKLQMIDPMRRLPLIIDDAFTNFDENRMNAAMEFLRTTGRQAILFSCQERDRAKDSKG